MQQGRGDRCEVPGGELVVARFRYDASLDGGVTFAPIPTPAGVAFYGIAALGQGRVIAVGSGSVHIRTNKTWKTEIPDELGISAVSATSLSDAWAVGAKGTILHRP